jgi:F-type H+-transporting ATPase subunit epsilon
MALDKSLRLVIVTPERTLFDGPAAALRFPLYDGEIGILPGRLPLVGRLGTGVLALTEAAGERRFFIDGGFVQNQVGTVTILTNRALPVAAISAESAEKELQQAMSQPAATPTDRQSKASAIQRAKKLVAVARKA